MGYLLPAEYAAFGLGDETADSWVVAASAVMEAYCRRPSLMAASYVERRRLGRGWPAVRLSYGPLVSVEAVRARYAPVHPEERCASGVATFAQAVGDAFGLPGAWVSLDVSALDVCVPLGEVRLVENVFAPRFSEMEVTYTAGLTSVPDAVKVACAGIVRNAQATPGLNVRSSKVDVLQMEYFSDSLIDAQVRALLRPYVAERMS